MGWYPLLHRTAFAAVECIALRRTAPVSRAPGGRGREDHGHLGRIEPRIRESQAAKELLAYLSNLRTRIDQGVRTDLMNIARRHRQAEVMVEKAVDVMLAVDLVIMAERNEFDAAYILSARRLPARRSGRPKPRQKGLRGIPRTRRAARLRRQLLHRVDAGVVHRLLHLYVVARAAPLERSRASVSSSEPGRTSAGRATNRRLSSTWP